MAFEPTNRRSPRKMTPTAKRRAEKIWALAGSGAWSGDLAEMRGDRPRRRAKPPKPSR